VQSEKSGAAFAARRNQFFGFAAKQMNEKRMNFLVETAQRKIPCTI